MCEQTPTKQIFTCDAILQPDTTHSTPQPIFPKTSHNGKPCDVELATQHLQHHEDILKEDEVKLMEDKLARQGDDQQATSNNGQAPA